MRRRIDMRKLIAATTLTLVLAATANAAEVRSADRGPRDRENPIVRAIKILKHYFTPSTQALPSTPVP
jgi:hypothetical protein